MAKQIKNEIEDEEGSTRTQSLSTQELLADKKFKDKKFLIRSGDQLKTKERISTGSVIFDIHLEGGFRAGSWARFYGSEESGKTSMGLCWAKNWQDHWKERARIKYINAEGRITKELCDRTGVNQKDPYFEIWDTNNADNAYDALEKLLLNNCDDLKYFVILDSTDAAVRSQDMEKSVSDREGLGGTATILSQAGKRLSALCSSGDHFLYLISQIRDNVNTYSPGAHSKGPSGGNAVKFYSSLTGEFKKPYPDMFILEGALGSQIIGRKVQIKLHKTPNEKSGIVVEYPVKYGLVGGVWRAFEAMMLCKGKDGWDYYKESGKWNKIVERRIQEFKDNNIPYEESFDGEKKMRDFFDANPTLVEYIIKNIKELAVK